MEASFSRRDLLTPAELRALTERSDSHGWLQMGSHVGAILFVALLHGAAMGTGWVWLTGLALGVLLNFLYAAQHELSHATVFKTRKWNEIFGRMVGFIQIFPRDFDQIMHFAHHHYTQDWDRDGELVREPYTIKTYLLWLSGATYWRNRILGIVRRARGTIIEPFIRKEEEVRVIRESRLHLAAYATIALLSLVTGSWAALTFWLLPMILTKPIHQLQNTIEHLGLSHADDILENTRSTRANALQNWLCWQMPYEVDREFWFPLSDHNMDLMSRVLQRPDSFQGRVASRQQNQLQLHFAQHQKWVDLFKGWWREGIADWRARNPNGDCIFVCELGPPGYAMTDANGVEMSNRWEEAQLIKQWVRDIWDELGGDS